MAKQKHGQTGRQGQMGERHEQQGQRQQGEQQPDRHGQKNEGEGNKTAARRYNKDQQDFVKSGQVDDAAERAKHAVESDEGDELEQAEEEGRSHARLAEEDRDYNKDSKKTQ